MKIALYTFLYFCSSLLLGFFSSYFFGITEYNFPYPIFVSSCQYLSQYLISSVLLLFMRYLNSHKTNSEHNISIKTLSNEEREPTRQKVPQEIYLNILCGLISSIDIALSVYSLKRSSLAFYTMIKSSSPIFILLNSFLLNVEKPSIKKFIIIFLISCGVFLTTINNNSSKVSYGNGFYVLLIASYIGGFRWAFTQYILQSDRFISKEGVCINGREDIIHTQVSIYTCDTNDMEKINRCDTIKSNGGDILNTNQGGMGYSTRKPSDSSLKHVLKTMKKLALPVFLSLLTISVVFEQPQLRVFEACNLRVILYSCILSNILIFSEFSLVNISNVMYLSVAGICKEIIIIAYSVLFKNLRFSKLNAVGVFITSLGILVFSLRN